MRKLLLALILTGAVMAQDMSYIKLQDFKWNQANNVVQFEGKFENTGMIDCQQVGILAEGFVGSGKDRTEAFKQEFTYKGKISGSGGKKSFRFTIPHREPLSYLQITVKEARF